jgi:hypothetical protein
MTFTLRRNRAGFVDRQLHPGHGKAFPRTVYSRMSEQIRLLGLESWFTRTGRGMYALSGPGTKVVDTY